MEEKKADGKEVKFVASKKGETKESPKKLTYEELNDVCMNLSQQNQQMQAYIQRLQSQLQQMDIYSQYKRIDYLFKVVEFASEINDPEFVGSCIDEIKESLTIPEQTEESKEK